MVGAELYGITVSTSPSLPKPGSILPVRALSAIMRRSAVKTMRAGLVLSPGQYVTARREGFPLGNWYRQISLPVSGSSAKTLLPAGRYVTPFTTMGVASEARAFSLNDHAWVSLATVLVLIWVSGE